MATKEDEKKSTPQGLATRDDIQKLTQAGNIKTTLEYANRIREMQAAAFVLSPVTAITAIAPGYEITPVVVVIDPSVDKKTGRGADVYHQPSIHKTVKHGDGRDAWWEAIEVSLNHYGLLRILAGFGVNVHETRWIADGIRERYLFVCETEGDIIDFDGRVRKLPTGIGSIDARDGSADIGEWTPEEWRKRVAVSDLQKEKTPKSDQWKCKPEAINGWTAERVMQVRKFGRQLAKTKSLNGLARKLGVRQSYTIKELETKPFVIMRPMWIPDLKNTEIARMVAAHHLGARASLFPHADDGISTVTHAIGEAGQTFDAHAIPASSTPTGLEEFAEAEETVETSAPPADAEEASFEEVKPKVETAAAAPPTPSFTITKVLRKTKGDVATFFIETKEGKTFYTPEIQTAKACDSAKKDGMPRVIDAESVAVEGQTYLQIIELRAANGLKL